MAERVASATNQSSIGSRATRVTNDLTGGQKETKLERYDLIPVRSLQSLARVYGQGATKYADRNWERQYNWGLSYAALQRHVNAFWSGEEVDPESGQPHLAHAAWHCFTLMQFADNYNELLDDRSKVGKEKA